MKFPPFLLSVFYHLNSHFPTCDVKKCWTVIKKDKQKSMAFFCFKLTFLLTDCARRISGLGLFSSFRFLMLWIWRNCWECFLLCTLPFTNLLYTNIFLLIFVYISSGWYITKVDDIHRFLWWSLQEGDSKIWPYLWRNSSKYRGARAIVAADPGAYLCIPVTHLERTNANTYKKRNIPLYLVGLFFIMWDYVAIHAGLYLRFLITTANEFPSNYFSSKYKLPFLYFMLLERVDLTCETKKCRLSSIMVEHFLSRCLYLLLIDGGGSDEF